MHTLPQKIMRADTVYTVSSATDHFREQGGAGFKVERAPDFANFTSELPHYPASTLRLRGDDRVPAFIPRDFRGSQADAAARCKSSLRAAVSGHNRHKYFQRPFLATTGPLILIKPPRPASPPNHSDAVHVEEPATRTIATQSLYRESDAQTDPWSPDAAQQAANAALSVKQLLHSDKFHCGNAPELAHLATLQFKLGDRASAADVAKVRNPHGCQTIQGLYKTRHAQPAFATWTLAS